MPITILSIPGMHCSSCAAMIRDISSEFPAITKVEVDLEKKTVTLDHGDNLDLAKWRQEVEAMGEPYKILPAS